MKQIIIAILLVGLLSCNRTSFDIGFTKISSASSGIDFSNTLKETHTYNYFTYPYMYLGGGVAVGDINNDGWEDIYFTGNMTTNRLYLNKGNFKFDDITETAGVQGDDRWYSGTAMVDINRDGYLDIYCSVGGKYGPNNNVLYINNGDNTFTESAEKYGVDCDGISMHATFLDYDLDQDLDLFIINYPPTSFTAPVEYYHYMLDNHPYEDSDRLLRNDGGKFVDVTEESGLRCFGLSLGVVAEDINGDRYPDIFISNDFNAPDFLFINNGDGTFSNEINTCLQQTSFFGMGADIADFNNDGHPDIFQLDMSAEDNFRSKANMSSMNPTAFYNSVRLGLHHQYMQNSLQLSHGNLPGELPLFSNIARLAGVSSTDWSWGGLLADFDNDGWKDLFVTNGIRRDVNNKDFYAKYRSFFDKMEKDPNYQNKEEEVELLNYLEELPSEKLANYLFHNQGDLTFESVAETWGLGEKTFSNGVAYSDLDKDGDLDLIVNNLEEVASVYRNNVTTRNYLQIELIGSADVLAHGAKVTLHANAGIQSQTYNVVRGYLSSVSPILHFGLQDITKIDSICVLWPDGSMQSQVDVDVNQLVIINHEPMGINTAPKTALNSKPIFQKVPWDAPYAHEENPFNDFEVEVLLPHKNSSLGPSLAVGDLNGDGLQDFVVGGAVGQPSGAFTQNKQGEFDKLEIPDLSADKYYEDLGIVIFDAEGDGDQDIYIASGGNEFPQGSDGYEDRFYENIDNSSFIRNREAVPDIKISGQELSLSDIDQDGDLDIFVGGRLVPKKYPFPADAYILENRSTAETPLFVEATNKFISDFEDLGLVTASIWSDFNSDGWDDLVVVGEWMPIRFFRNDQGKLVDVTAEVLPGKHNSWWWALEQGDFDQDGDLDLVVGNLGKNYKYQATEAQPFTVYLNDFDNNETQDIVLSYQKDDTEYPVRGRQCSSEQMPAIKAKFQDYNSFASANLEQIYTTKLLDESLSYSVTTFASVYLENTGGKFEMHELPQQAQISSINKIVSDDFNADGHLDFIVAGNLYNAEVETPRNDASFGQYLQGDGHGNFKAVPMLESGLSIVGDVRGLESVVIGGELHLLIAVNDAAMQLVRVGLKPDTL